MQNFHWVLFTPLTLFFWFDSIIQGQFGLMISCIIVLKQFVWLFAKETGKRHFLTFHGSGCKEKKSFLNNMNLINSNYHLKNLVSWMSTKWRKCVSLKGFQFEKNDPKVKKHVPLNILTTFHKSFIYHGRLEQQGPCYDTNMRPSFLNSWLSF